MAHASSAASFISVLHSLALFLQLQSLTVPWTSTSYVVESAHFGVGDSRQYSDIVTPKTASASGQSCVWLALVLPKGVAK